MPELFTYASATVGAWCLFSPHSFLWLVPAACLAAAAHLTRAQHVASWTVAVFSALLALWSVWAFRRAQQPEGVSLILLGLTPLMQLFAIAAVLMPLLLGQRRHGRPPGLAPRSGGPPPRSGR